MNIGDIKTLTWPGRPGRRDLAAALAQALAVRLSPTLAVPGRPDRRRSAEDSNHSGQHGERDAAFCEDEA